MPEKMKPSSKRRLTYLETTTDLHIIEAMVRDFAEKVGIHHRVNQTVQRIFTAAVSVQRRTGKRDGTIQIGRIRMIEIYTALAPTGWNLRQCVEQKMPLLFLEPKLKESVRNSRLEPTKALLIARAAKADQAKLLNDVLTEGLSVRAIKARLNLSVSTKKPAKAILTQVDDSVLAADLEMVSRAASRVLGTRVTVSMSQILIDCHDMDGVTAMLERLGIEL
jgi:hypothetical protein